MKIGIKTIITGAVLFILGAFVIPILFVLPLILGSSNAVQFKIPGTIQAPIEKLGRYYLWNDFQTIYGGRSYNRSERIPDGMEIGIRNSKGELLAFVSDTSISTTAGSSSKNSIGYVEVKSPENVRIVVSGGNEERIFSFAESGLLKMFGLILGGFGLSMLVAISGIGITIWGIVKLVRANKSGKKPPEGLSAYLTRLEPGPKRVTRPCPFPLVRGKVGALLKQMNNATIAELQEKDDLASLVLKTD